MRILFTNNTLSNRSGTELFVRDLAVRLVRLGHQVAAYSTVIGDVAEELRGAGVFVCERLGDLPWRPDIIHGHHNAETMTALLFYERTPAIFVAHGWVPWQEIPPLHPRIVQYVAVDEPTRHAAVTVHGVAPERIRVQPNFVDLERFRPRPALPPAPRRALVLSNYVDERSAAAVREACAQAGIEVDVRGRSIGHMARHPEDVLPQYDVVFAKGRAALEAVSVGNAVIVSDTFGVGPMVSLRNARELRTLSCDFRKLVVPLSAQAIARELKRYDPVDAARVSRLARAHVGLDRAVRAFLRIYEDSAARFLSSVPDTEAEAAAEAAYVAWLAARVKQNAGPRAWYSLAEHMRASLEARVPMLRPLFDAVRRSMKSTRTP
jgi:glycosyltransferase involved in cell wall biosynthesis